MANLISCDDYGAPDKIYIHSGIGSSVTNSFGSPSVHPSGLTYDGDNMISCDRDSDKIYVHSVLVVLFRVVLERLLGIRRVLLMTVLI